MGRKKTPPRMRSFRRIFLVVRRFRSRSFISIWQSIENFPDLVGGWQALFNCVPWFRGHLSRVAALGPRHPFSTCRCHAVRCFLCSILLYLFIFPPPKKYFFVICSCSSCSFFLEGWEMLSFNAVWRVRCLFFVEWCSLHFFFIFFNELNLFWING